MTTLLEHHRKIIEQTITGIRHQLSEASPQQKVVSQKWTVGYANTLANALEALIQEVETIEEAS